MLAACTPTPEPKPTKTALFASDEEAFAAAEETYRAYTDATNQTVLDEPSTIEDVYSWLLDPALASAKEYYTSFAAENIHREGNSSYDSFEGVSFVSGLVTVNLCIDVSKVQLLDDGGHSVVPPDRVSRQPLRVELVEAETSTGLAIRSNIPAEDYPC